MNAAVMDQLAQHGPLAALLLFFFMFLVFAFWAYHPANKMRFESYGRIPLIDPHETDESAAGSDTKLKMGTP